MAKTKITTFALILNSRPNRFGNYAVYIRIIQDRKITKFKTSVEVAKQHWNPEGKKNENWVRQGDPDYAKKNDALSKELGKVVDTYRSLKHDSIATPERIVAAVAAGESSPVFLKIEPNGMSGFAAERTQQILDAGGIRNWKKHNGFLNKMASFMSDGLNHKTELLFSEITPEFVTRFDAYLHTLRNSRSKNEADKMLHPNSIAAVLTAFRAVVRKSMEIGYIAPDKNPFLAFKINSVKTEKEKLDMAEIEALQALEIVKGSVDWNSLNCFLFSFYCAGIRASDLLMLRWCNVEGGRLHYQMGKNHKIRDLMLVPQAMEILDMYRNDTCEPTDYIFPFMDNRKPYSKAIHQSDRDKLPSETKKQLYADTSSKNALINKSLRRLAVKAGISKKLSMHIARHSFASIAARKGIDSNKVKGLLAHSRLQTTECYMGEFSTDENDQALESIFEAKVDKKAQLLELIKHMSQEEISSVLDALHK